MLAEGLRHHFDVHQPFNRERGLAGFMMSIGMTEAYWTRRRNSSLALANYVATILGIQERVPPVINPGRSFTLAKNFLLDAGPTLFSDTSGQIILARARDEQKDQVSYPTIFSGLITTVLNPYHFAFTLGLYSANCPPNQLTQLPFTNSPLLVSGEFDTRNGNIQVEMENMPVPHIRNSMTPPATTHGRRQRLQYATQLSNPEVVAAWLGHFATDFPQQNSPFGEFLRPQPPLIKKK